MTKTSEAKKEYTKTMAYLNSNRDDIENDTYTRLADKAWKKLNDAEARKEHATRIKLHREHLLRRDAYFKSKREMTKTAS